MSNRLDKTAAIFLAAVAFFGGCVHASTPIMDAHFKITFSVPDGFRESTETRQRAKASYAYSRLPDSPGHLPTLIILKGMGGIIGREALNDFTAPNGALAKVSTLKWKSLDIFVARVPENANGQKALNLVAQVPLKAEAMTVTVFGNADNEAELQTLLASVLATIDGPSNWLTNDQRIDKLAGLAGGGIGIAGVLFWMSRRKKKTA